MFGLFKKKENSDPTLFEKIGGAPAVDAAVDIFYKKVLADERINMYFENVDMEGQIAKQKAFLTMAFGGPNNYTGKSLAEGHKGMNLQDVHFNAVAECLVGTLKELEVAEENINAVVDICLSVKDDVLNK